VNVSKSLFIQNEIRRSEDGTLSGVLRSGIRHSLIDTAHRMQDSEAWTDIGNALIRAAETDDLSPQVSDHFVRACPDAIFAGFALDNAACRFTRWRLKTRTAHSQYSVSASV
jgi:hypothetical protein